MRRPLDFRPAAELDTLQYAEYIAHESPTAAGRFLAGVDATFAKIAENPGRGHPREVVNASLAGIRTMQVVGFPKHLVFYRILDDDSVLVLRVRHGAMDIEAIPMDE